MKKVIIFGLALAVCFLCISCADTTELETAIPTIIENVEDEDAYTPNSYAVYKDALDAANYIVSNGTLWQSDVTDAIDKLEESVQNLQKRADKTELIQKTEEAKMIEDEGFLPITYSNLIAAIGNAGAYIADDNTTEEDVSNAIDVLEEAILSLELIPDKTELKNLLESAAEYTEKKYTTITYDALQEAIATARTVYDDVNANQQNVDENVIMLQERVDGLIKSTKCIWKITVDLNLVKNNDIGDDWSTSIKYKGKSVDDSFEITAKEGAEIKITGKAVENDNIPEKGSTTITLKLKDGKTVDKTFTVRENRGRNAGNTAKWKLVVSCELIERI